MKIENKELRESIFNTIKNRTRYLFKWRRIMYSIFWFPQINWKWRRNTKIANDNKMLMIGENKMNKELDIKYIIESIRKANILASALLDQKQIILSNYHKNNMIQTNEAKQDINWKENIETDANQILIEGGLDVDNKISQRFIEGVLGKRSLALQEWKLADNSVESQLTLRNID